MAPFFIGMALAEERKVDALAAGLLSVAAFMTVTPYSVGEAYAVGANWLGGANIISGIIIGLVVAVKRRTKNAKTFHDKCEKFNFRASNETAALTAVFLFIKWDHFG